MYAATNILDIYNMFLAEQGFPMLKDKKHLAYEDVYPVLYLKYLLEGVGKKRMMKHLIIDEMQDYTYLQYTLLQLMFNCPMTILGDKEQTMEQDASSLLTFLPQIFGRKAKVMTLDKSYRSTTEITEFAAHLAHLDHQNCFERHGEPIGLHTLPDTDSMIHAIAEKLLSQTSSDTRAVLCKTLEEAVFVQDALMQSGLIPDEVPLNLIDTESEHFGTGITIMPFYLAKGLEFDSVHVAFAQEKNYPEEVHSQLLYICATRALHTLDFYSAGDMAKILSQ